MIIKPTVGRIVWYRPSYEPGSDDAIAGIMVQEPTPPDGPQPFAAVVVFVHGDRSVDLCVFAHGQGVRGEPLPVQYRRHVYLAQEMDPRPVLGSYCEWMPYQIGQAKKHEGAKPDPLDITELLERADMAGYKRGHAEGFAEASGLQLGLTAQGDVIASAKRASRRQFPVCGYHFGAALEAARMGCKIYRAGWNGRKAGVDQFVVYMEPLELPPYSTQGTARKVNDRTAKWIGEDTPLHCRPYFAMHNGGGDWQPGWLASQSDMLANDWCIEAVLQNPELAELVEKSAADAADAVSGD